MNIYAIITDDCAFIVAAETRGKAHIYGMSELDWEWMEFTLPMSIRLVAKDIVDVTRGFVPAHRLDLWDLAFEKFRIIPAAAYWDDECGHYVVENNGERILY